MGTCSFTQRKYSHVPLLSQVLQKGSRQGYDWSMTGGRQIFIGSGHIGERPKQTQSCSRQVLESFSKVSYPHDLLFRCQKQNASKRWWDAALQKRSAGKKRGGMQTVLFTVSCLCIDCTYTLTCQCLISPCPLVRVSQIVSHCIVITWQTAARATSRSASNWLSVYPERFQSLKDVLLYVFHRFPRQLAQKLRRQTFVVRMRSSAARYSQTGLDNT